MFELEEIQALVNSITGRPDISIGPYILSVSEEIRLSGTYREDLVVEQVYYDQGGGYDWGLDYSSDLGEFKLYANSEDYEYSPVALQLMTVSFGEGKASEVVHHLSPEAVRKSRGCAPANFYRHRGINSFEGRLQGEPYFIEIVFYSRSPFYMEQHKSYGLPWPVESCPQVVIQGIAARVMLAAGDDPSRDRMYVEFQRLLRQFQLSRVTIEE